MPQNKKKLMNKAKFSFLYHKNLLKFTPKQIPKKKFSSTTTNSQTHDFVSLLKAYSQIPHLLQIHGHLLRCCESSVFIYNTLIKAYSVTNRPVYGVLIYRDMKRQSIYYNSLTLSFVTKCLVRVLCLRGGVEIHCRILRDGFQLDSLLLTNLMDLYSLCGMGTEACKVFDEMCRRDTVAWNVLISCYVRNARYMDALGAFDAMVSGQVARVVPDDVTCLIVLQACANLGALEFGEKVHGYIGECGFGDATYLCNSLVATYSRCGSLDKAWNVFNGMRNKNVVTYSAMISGFAMHGRGREAIETFGEMKRMGVSPDDHTFTGVLSACSHCGLVDEGMMFFERMSKEFGITPNIHHYGCVVDLLGRAGQLDRAYQLILSLPIKPDSKIWRTLLGACRIHRHVTIGERAVRHLIELKAEEPADYVLLLNIYSSVGNWEMVKEVRKFMQQKKIQTTPGCSSMILKGEVHEFVVDDDQHPLKNELYEILDEINKWLKTAGYVPKITSELHNLDANEKEHQLSYHSEKLAIAFGILATPPHTTIRISKNLRICVDCHNFAKVLSGVCKREIIIRDRTRFHHFREGNCSCNDYW